MQFLNMSKNGNNISIFWFRRDLRLEDNHGLYQALKSGNPVLAVFIFDKNILSQLSDTSDKRISFIHQALTALNVQLKKNGSALYVLYDEPLRAFETICSSFDVKEVFTNNDYEPYALERDNTISEFLKSKNILFHSFKDQVVFEKSEVMKLDGTPYTIFTPYSKIWKQKLSENKIVNYASETLLNNIFKTEPLHFPSFNELGFESVKSDLFSININKQIISDYDKTRNIPSINGTSKLSIHLRFGTISIRQLVTIATQINEQWLNELIWREFFMMILFQFPNVVTKCFKSKYENIIWRNNENEFELWCNGKTGYPIVDAGMRELNETGFMHNRVRMIVASFLTKHLLIDWRWGEAYFAEKLLDYELSSNNGNWQWAAGCGCDAAPYFRIFSAEEQMKKFDPELNYIRKWIKNFKPGYQPPIVENSFARKRAIETYKKALTEIY